MNRAERRRRTFNVVRYRTEQADLSGLFLEVDDDGVIRDYFDPKKIGTYKKSNPFNCGNPRCYLCTNPRKMYKEKTRHEQIAALTAREQINESRTLSQMW